MGKMQVETVSKDRKVVDLDTDLIYDYIKNDIDDVKDFFFQRIEKGENCAKFYKGDQWTEEEKQAHTQQMRYPFVYNEILPAVDHLIGSQQSTRMDSRVVGREQGDNMAAQLLTFLLKWAEQVNKLDIVETSVFKSAIIRGRGVAAVYWDSDDILFGYPKIDFMPSHEFYWDLSAITPDLSDARWMARVTSKTRMDLCELYPEYSDEIMNMPFDECIVPEINRGKSRGYNPGRRQDLYSHRELLEHVEHCEKIKIFSYSVVDDIAANTTVFDSKSEAKSYYEGLVNGYSQAGENIFYDDFTPKITFITTAINRVIYTACIGNLIAKRQLTSLSEFPYVVCFAYFDEGDFWGFIDNLLSPQIGINRAYSQWDYSLGTSMKNPITVMKSMLASGWTVEHVKREISKTSPVIPVNAHGAIQVLQSPPINQQIFNAIPFNISRIVDYSGGKNVRGFTENAAESGKAVVARAEQGGVSKLPLFDSLRLWRKGIAERVVWYLKNYMPQPQILRILGTDEEISYIPLDDGILNTLQEVKFDVTVDEAIKSETVKERYFDQVMKFSQMGAIPGELISELMVEYSSLPESKKETLRSSLVAYKEAKQQEMEIAKQQKMMGQVQDSLTKKKLKEQAEAQDGISATQEELNTRAKSIETQRRSLIADAEELKNLTQQKK